MSAGASLTCKEIVEIITEYLEGNMPAEERARFEAHVENCSGCQVYIEQMRQTIQALGKLAKGHLSPQAQETLLGAFRDWKKRTSGGL